MSKRQPPRFKLGDRVVFSDTVVKDRSKDSEVIWVSNGLPKRVSYRMDENRRWYDHVREFTEGIVVGQRMLAQYYIGNETESDGWRNYSYTTVEQVPGTAKKAWLVSYELHRKPVLVLDGHLAKAPLKWVPLEESEQQKIIDWLARKLATTNNGHHPPRKGEMTAEDWYHTAREATSDDAMRWN